MNAFDSQDDIAVLRWSQVDHDGQSLGAIEAKSGRYPVFGRDDSDDSSSMIDGEELSLISEWRSIYKAGSSFMITINDSSS